ncbi:MAG: HAMP domain-containing histidine kinase [Clostridiales bacterium]|nr:HAMP domain-containing histidine kinase [Clostridiales bacterium]
MKNKLYLKKYLLQSLFIIIIFLALLLIVNNIEYNQYKKTFNYKINAILETVQEEYPNIKKEELIKILDSKEISDNILLEYGYDIEKDSFIQQNNNISFTFNIIKGMILVIAFAVITYIFVKSHIESDKEIEKIIKCIEDINHKNYELKIDDLSEDKLSILKQEIYKTTIMLKENAENSLKDKIDLKNSLQDISHQLKTPLTSISIMLDNIIDDPEMDNDVRQNFIKQIKREITNISFLVQSILKLSKFESNTIDFNRKEVSIKNIINETIRNVSNLCDLKDVEIKVNDKCKNNIYCDSKWQVEAITNILKNAVEYSNSGSKVLIECEDNNLYSQIKIIDYGKGMDEEDTLNIFKRFYKGKDSTKDSIGIGLSLSKAIIEEDNGRIAVESEKNKGTIFTIKYFYK